jgi:hypothetical protein
MVGRMTGRRPSIWKVLTDAEHVVVMQRLLRERPEMREEARRIATLLLAQTKRSEVAREVRRAVEAVTTGEVAARSGRQPGGGYVEASEVAWELLSAAVEPFVQRLRSLVELRQPQAATEVGTGILLGLANVKGNEMCAVFFETDFIAEEVAEVVEAMEEAGLRADRAKDLV